METGPGTSDTLSQNAELRVLQVTDGWAMGEVASCLVIVWRTQPTTDAFRFRNERLLELAARVPGQCALVELVETGSKPPTDETRRVAMDVFQRLGKNLSVVGFVIEGSEIRSTLARAVLTGMTFFVKQLQPTKVFKRPVDVASWIAARVHGGNPAIASQLVTAFEQLRGAIGKR